MAKPNNRKTLGKALPLFRGIEDRAVNAICIGLLIAVLFFACCILIVIIQAAFSGDWCIRINAEGIKNMQVFWKEHSSLLGAFFYSMTLFVACHTLIKYIDVETGRSLGEIRSKLNEEPKKLIHNHFIKTSENKDVTKHLDGMVISQKTANGDMDLTAVEVYDYLGTLELGAIMLHRGIITEEEFFDQFGYRFIYIGRSKLMGMIERDSMYYEPLLYAMEVALKHNKKAAKAKKRAKDKSAVDGIEKRTKAPAKSKAKKKHKALPLGK